MINIKNIFKAKKKYQETFKDKVYVPKITIFSGAGISRESGILTFRDTDGLWNNHSISEVATASAIRNNLSVVLKFYNERRREIQNAHPNKAHYLIKELEKYFDVVVVTQNVDDFHERAGSSKVLHLHGSILESRPVANRKIVHPQSNDINIGDRCPTTKSQLRPNIILFGEKLNETLYYEARKHIRESDILIVTGTSLSVEPAASLVAEGFGTRYAFIIDPNDVQTKYHSNYIHIKEVSSVGIDQLLPKLIEESKLLKEKRET